MTRRALLLPILLIAAMSPLAGCGGGNSDEDQINDVITTAATTNADSNCTELETRRFLEQIEFETGEAAVQSCKSSGPESNADSVDVSNIEIDGNTATADVAVTGAAFDGQTIKVSLVKQGDQWKIDHFDSFVEFDQQALAEAFAENVQQGKDPGTAAQGKCVRDKINAAPAGAVQTAVLSGNSDAFGALIGACFQ
jgi:hypothetical protein